MATNRERLDRLETSVQEIQTSIQQLLDRGHDHQNPWGRGRTGSPNPSDESEGESSEGSQASNASQKSHASNKGDRHKKRSSFRMGFLRFSGEEPRTSSFRMDFLRFSGEEPRTWLMNRAHQFFMRLLPMFRC